MAALLLALFAPNSVEWLTARGFVSHHESGPEAPSPWAALGWAPTHAWALGSAALAVLGLLFLVRDLARESPFLYFQF
jgi:hypothetical protein